MFINVIFFNCSLNNDDELSTDEECKTCDDFTSSGATLMICDNENNTVTVTISLSGIDVYNDIIEIKEGTDFSELDCDDFNDLIEYNKAQESQNMN